MSLSIAQIAAARRAARLASGATAPTTSAPTTGLAGLFNKFNEWNDDTARAMREDARARAQQDLAEFRDHLKEARIAEGYSF